MRVADMASGPPHINGSDGAPRNGDPDDRTGLESEMAQSVQRQPDASRIHIPGQRLLHQCLGQGAALRAHALS